MSRMAVLVFLVLFVVLLPTTPAQGQDSGGDQREQIEELIEKLGDEDEGVRLKAALALSTFGSPAAQALVAAIPAEHDSNFCAAVVWALGQIGSAAVPVLIAPLSSTDKHLRSHAAFALARIGPGAASAVPALTAALAEANPGVRASLVVALGNVGSEAAPAISALIGLLSDEDETVRGVTAMGLNRIGNSLKSEGTVLFWVVPRVYSKELVVLCLLLAAWFALVARFPRCRPTRTSRHVVLTALSAALPVALTCSAVGYGISREWAQGFLPDAVTLVPFRVAAVLSTALVCTLPAVWACQRKGLAAGETSAS